MPKRWIETDEDRLPEGMTRVGYDADEQRYTFRDAQGLWIGEEGNEYGGRLTYAGPAPPGMPEGEPRARSERATYAPLAPFLLLICIVLLLLWRYLPSDAPPVLCGKDETPSKVHKGDTCWDLAQASNLSLEDFLQHNPHLDCDMLRPGQTICLPVRHS